MAEKRPWLKFWPEGVPKTIQYPEIPVFQLLDRSSQNYPTRTALVFEGQHVSYKKLNELTKRFAAALANLGVKSGDRVMLFLLNIPEFVISYYGVLRNGAIITPANPLFKERELRYQIDNSGAKTIIVHESLLSIISNVREKSKLDNVIVVAQRKYPDTILFEETVRGSEPRPPSVRIDPKESVAVLQYTGGTTGLPKGAMMTHYNLVSNAIMNAKWFKWTSNEVVMGVLPLYHTWGSNVCMNSVFYTGASVILIQRFDPEKALKTVEKEKVTAWYGSATMFNILVNHPTIERYNLSSLRHVKAGAMPIPEEVKRKWDKLTGVELILGYGLTEASPETHNSPPGRVKIGTIGIPIIDTDAKIVDVETRSKELTLGQIGELAIKGPQVMKGYWNMPEETEKALRDGWLYTGDVAKMDEEGYFYIVDRLKDMIKYKGYGVYPAEVENVLYEHPAVKECMVIGKPDPRVGEIPKAFVVLKEGAHASEEQLIKFCEDKIAAYKRIREVEFVSELPKTAVGKLLRRVLRDREHEKLKS